MLEWQIFIKGFHDSIDDITGQYTIINENITNDKMKNKLNELESKVWLKKKKKWFFMDNFVLFFFLFTKLLLLLLLGWDFNKRKRWSVKTSKIKFKSRNFKDNNHR